MKWTIGLFALASVALAQTNANYSVDVGGSNPPMTFPNVISYNTLNGPYQHVVILSIDGFHQVHPPFRFRSSSWQGDLSAYIKLRPKSALANLSQNAVLYSNVETSKPSDSFPGSTALYTGATPRTSGIWYDNWYDKELFPFEAACNGTPGFNILGDETIDVDFTLYSGGGAFDLTHLPYKRTSWGSCTYLYPHQFLRVKTIFEVIRENGGFTKLCDKHPSYEMFNGLSGTGLYV